MVLQTQVQNTLNLYEDRSDYLRYNSIKNILEHLQDCGKEKKLQFFCKKCEKEHNPALLRVTKRQVFCDIRYCDNPYCKNQLFARQMDAFRTIFTDKTLSGWNNLWHFTIGFKSVTIKEFKNNFKQILKRYQYVLNNFWRKLNKQGLNIKALRVLDFSFETDGKVYIHFHFGAIPLKSAIRREFMVKLKAIEKSMNKNMKIKTPFVFESHGYKPKNAIMSYLAKRSIGLYKHDECKVDPKEWANPDEKGKLIKDIQTGKYFMFSSFLTLLDYYDHFYKARHFACVGGLPQPCIPVSSFVNDYPKTCPIHGFLDHTDIRVEVIDYNPT